MRERLVVDASVAAKWILRDEQDVERADAVKRRYDCGQIDLLAPGQIRVEVANAIRRAALRAHSPIGRADAAEALRAWLEMKLDLVESEVLLEDALRIALAQGTSLFDALAHGSAH